MKAKSFVYTPEQSATVGFVQRVAPGPGPGPGPGPEPVLPMQQPAHRLAVLRPADNNSDYMQVSHPG